MAYFPVFMAERLFVYPLGGNRNATVGSYIFVVLFLAGTFLMSVNLFHLSYMWAGGVSAILLLIFVLPPLINKNPKGIAANFNLLTTMLLGGFGMVQAGTLLSGVPCMVYH